LPRSDFGAGFMNGESDDGGMEEFCEFCFSWASSSAIRARSSTIKAACAATKTANSSYEGCDGVDTSTMIHAQASTIKPPLRQRRS
jgi:hypothetical protein